MENIIDALTRFLDKPTIKVASLTGEWGVGKTYCWKKFVAEKREAKEVKKYAYVSLFGLKNVEAVNEKILASLFSGDWAEKIDNKQWSTVVRTIKGVVKQTNEIKMHSISPRMLTSVIQEAMFKNMIICIDDLERREDSLNLSAVLGLISQFAEEKESKVILIFNNVKLSPTDKSKFDEFKEKVIDAEIGYRPSIASNLAIVWPEMCPSYVSDAFQNCGINNIRVMKKACDIIDFFDVPLALYPRIKDDFLGQAVVLAIFYYAFGADFRLRELETKSFVKILVGDDAADKARFDVVKKAKFFSRAYDPLIIAFLETGWAEVSVFAEILKEEEIDTEKGEIFEQFSALWLNYNGNFVASQNDFTTKLGTFIRENYQKLKPVDVFDSMDFIESLDSGADFSDLTESMVEYYANKDNFNARQNLRNSEKFGQIWAEIMRRRSAKIEKKPMLALLASLTERNEWRVDELRYISAYSREEYCEWLRTETSNELIPMLHELFIRFGHDESQSLMLQPLRDAIDLLGREGVFNQKRVVECIGLPAAPKAI
jgi:hypothetical protein